ncbi:TetR family transcriptional regulator [Acrocarpospora pleiomorpha]|uniref:TetR family transcriptional regulator n=1 Tax=Acrocarpospora pleiomorpha TaxID=90975 RepID=A0A5M3XDP5_9ACTN|nr:TetR/AcrR family transcriptional regulator [Acrocarpospora pleiomorpha]GES19384.1 TetR family transcriptional regulator [Acrocarpospora pleiomorpha]
MADRLAQIVAAARELLETQGPEAVSMRRIADRLGIRAPSLYKHLPDKAAVESALQAEGLAGLAEALEAAEAGRRDGPALSALAAAYRQFALEHPHLYRLTSDRPLARDALPPGLEARAVAPLLRAVGGDIDVARAVWAFAHGMVLLELDGRFPPGTDLTGAWLAGTTAFAVPRHPLTT